VEERDTKYSGPEKCGADVVATRILKKFPPRKISRSSAPEEFEGGNFCSFAYLIIVCGKRARRSTE
jgi:hypothetical protein